VYIKFTTKDLDILAYTYGMLVPAVNSKMPLICATLVKIEHWTLMRTMMMDDGMCYDVIFWAYVDCSIHPYTV
jgi:hypothetical protein